MRRGSGQDTLYEFDETVGNSDTVYMGGLTQDDITVKRIETDLIVSIQGTDDTFTISNWFGNERCRVERILFSDGNEWDTETIRKMALMGTPEDDILMGYETDDEISGLDGNDWISGESGDDTLDGGAGNDSLVGGAGNDSYLFGRGYGQDTIADFDTISGTVDTVRIKDALPSELCIKLIGLDLAIEIAETDDRMIVKNWIRGEQYQIERIEFDSDGTVWDAEMIQYMLCTPEDSDDVLIGTPGNDALDGGGGDDHLYGLGGDDQSTLR